MQYGFVIDHRKCIGCHACTVACKSENEVPVGDFRTWVKYTEVGTFPAVRRHFAVLRCNQCTNAPCVTICPVSALDKRVDGIVDLDKDVCIGCKACMQACPYDALYLNEETGSVEKCHFCAHRVEQGLKPACEVVCPEEAIISGDMHDPNSRPNQLLHTVPGGVTRAPEQNTGPNVWYLGMDDVSLQPGLAKEEDTYIWSDRQQPAPPYTDEAAQAMTQSDARTVLDVGHKVHWGWRVSMYLLTKGVASGAAILAPFFATGVIGNSGRYVPEVLVMVFMALTAVLLVWDLKRPMKFLTIMLRPNWRSWLVKGSFVITAFGGVTAAIIAARLFGFEATADFLRWPNLLLGAGTAGYTAMLFAQCEGRDLWQNTSLLLPHLLVQAVMLGGLAMLPWLGSTALVITIVVAAVLHLLCGLQERRGKHETRNAKQAAALLGQVPAFRFAPRKSRAGAREEDEQRVSAFWLGLALTTGVAVLLLGLLATATLTPVLAVVLALAAFAGTYWYEHAYIQAGQLPPLS